MIKPKSIKVSKLTKSNLKKELVFTRIRRSYKVASFKRNITLSTKNNADDDYYEKNLKNFYEINFEKLYMKKLNELLKNDLKKTAGRFLNFKKGVFEIARYTPLLCGLTSGNVKEFDDVFTADLTGFTQTPIIMYFLKAYQENRDESISYKILSETINSKKLNCTFRIDRNRYVGDFKLEIEWLAIGF
ncbi:unnamed protein product [Brachionus calyciflorus]|uniref:Uncharacterized protein n=1 Tax=Brachionus calyciflorus TaxID=104777 RepID=A0A813R215_9BILA|nr:unnamed protein product [Brachionus calyciflorus]